eukprot:1986939-Ditylum_brightwellii.AAC.1
MLRPFDFDVRIFTTVGGSCVTPLYVETTEKGHFPPYLKHPGRAELVPTRQKCLLVGDRWAEQVPTRRKLKLGQNGRFDSFGRTSSITSVTN